MANDDEAMTQMRLHQECWELLPWVANGRLAAAEAARVSHHLENCARCSAELRIQQQLRQALRSEDSVVLAPQAGLRKLWHRLDAEATTHDGDGQGAAGQTHLQEAALGVSSYQPPVISRPMRVAIAAQTLLIIGLLGWIGWQAVEDWQAPRFVTVTAPAVNQGGTLRVVFTAEASLGKVNELLRSINAEIVGGPSPAGVFTLGLPAGTSANVAAVIARRLRADPQVRFAESTLAGPAATPAVQP